MIQINNPADCCGSIADFWGWEKTNPTFNADNKGCSLVLLNTEKGRKLFGMLKDRMDIIPANLKDCLQPNLQHSTEIHPERDKFEKEYSQKGFEYVYYKYGGEGWRYKLEVKLHRLKHIIKKIIGRK